jgi:hypothetical protein
MIGPSARARIRKEIIMTRRILCKTLLVVVAAIGLFVLSGVLLAQGNSDAAFERVKAVQERHTDRLMSIEGVEGTAVGLDENRQHQVTVFTARRGVGGIPRNLEGVPVEVVVTGKFYALAKPSVPPGQASRPPKDRTPPAAPTDLTASAVSSSQIDLTWTANTEPDLSYYKVYRSTTSAGTYGKIGSATSPNYSDIGLPSSTTYWYKVTAVDTSGNESLKCTPVSATTAAGPMPPLWCTRPVPIGVSTGHPDITAGTIGCRVVDGAGNVYALSNNHVYANENKAAIGDNVLQPGSYDGGLNPRDAIGTLYGFQPIVFSRRANNTIDAAIALSSTANLDNQTPGAGYGTPSSTTVQPSVGQPVQKYGRTTLLTTGNVYAFNATVNVGYSSGTARFVNQIMITPGTFSAGGDSGSLIVTDDKNLNPIGLLFAGSSTMTIANPIGAVLSAFDVTIDGE